MTHDPRHDSAIHGDDGPAPWDDEHEDEGGAPAPNGIAAANGADDLPVIKVFGGSLACNRREAEAALALRGMHDPMRAIYQRGGVLVRIHRIPQAGADRCGVERPAGTPSIVPCEPGFLRCHLAEVATWAKYDGRRKCDVAINPPPDVVPPLLAGPWKAIQPLTGILETRALLPDGSLLAGQGYHPTTGLLLDTITIPPIQPSRTAAEAALKILLEIYAGFPFVGEVDRAVALATPLSGLQAGVLDATPLIASDAPTPGSGKTLLSEVAGYIATGRRPAAMTQASSEEEDKKRLLSVLLGGDQMALIDNIYRPLESDALCAILTGAEYEDRILGASRKVRLRSRMLWTATGNNLRIVGDLIRRSLGCRIDPRCERPDARAFDVDLHVEVPRRRTELVHAALTIMASYAAAGRPHPLPPYGNFDSWSRMVREPLAWLGMADPCDSRDALAGSDPETEALASLMDAWWRCFADQPVLIKDVITKTHTVTAETIALRDAIANVAVERGGRGTLGQAIGFYLRSKLDRVHRGRCFARGEGDKDAGAARWRLLEC